MGQLFACMFLKFWNQEGNSVLKYFVDTTEALLSMALLTGLLWFYASTFCGKKGTVCTAAGLLSGLAGAGIMAWLKNTTKLIDTSIWTLRLFAISLAALLLFFIFSALHKKITNISEWVISILSGVMIIIAEVYALPDVFAYPYNILLVEKSVLSTAFIFKSIGILLGFLLIFLAGLSAGKGLQRLEHKKALLVLNLALIVNALRQITMCLRIMLTKRMIQNHTLFGDVSFFKIAQFSSNHESWFVYGILLVTLTIPVILFIKSMHVNEPYKTPAEHRKIRKKWLVTRRWAGFFSACLVMSVLNITVIKAAANKEVELSPVEDAPVIDGNVCVSFEQVEDGHLHRFAYTTENNVTIRFIVIKKPNSSSYGIGLDACDICGETGYYEKDGQVVCNLCDVVMNINTIGFKGGCNPIVIPYAIENGKILVPVDGLVEFEKEFK